MQLLPLIDDVCFIRGLFFLFCFFNALSIVHNQNVGPKFSHPDLIITLQYNGFAMLFRYWVYFVCLSAMLLFYDVKVFVLCTPNVLGLLSLRCAASLFALPPSCVCVCVSAWHR